MQDAHVKGGAEFDDEAVTALVDVCHEFGSLIRDPSFMANDSEESIRRFMKSAATKIALRAAEYLSHHEWDYSDALYELRAPL